MMMSDLICSPEVCIMIASTQQPLKAVTISVALDPTEAARQELDRQRIGSGFRPAVVRRQGCVPLVGRRVKMGCGSSKTVKSGTNQVFCIVGPPGSIKSVLCETLSKHHGYGYVTLGEAQRR